VVDFKEQALLEAGDLRDALKSGAISAEAIDTELGEVVTGRKPGRQGDRDITLFKSVGMAIQDVATAAFAYQQALASGVGTQIEMDGAAMPLVKTGLHGQRPGLELGA